MKREHKLGLAFVAICVILVGARIGVKVASESGNGNVSSSDAQMVFPGTGNKSDWLEAMKDFKQASSAFKKKNFDTAIDYDQQAITKYPYEAKLYNHLAIAHFLRGRVGDVEAGEQMMRQAINLKPDDCSYWDNLAKALCMENKVQEAREALVKALECNPTAQQNDEITQNIAIIDERLQNSQVQQ